MSDFNKSVRLHTYYSEELSEVLEKRKEYIDPCGDSFCYASCSMEECKKTCLIKEKKDEHLSLDEHLRNLDKEN